MITTREQASIALFQLLKSSYTFVTSSRRFRSWEDVSSAAKPALYLLAYSEEHVRAKLPTPAQRVLMFEVLIFIASGLSQSESVIPSTTLNTIIDAIDPVSGGVLTPDDTSQNRQTLGGLVYDCYIEGTIKKVPGDIDGQGMAVIPIKIIFNR